MNTKLQFFKVLIRTRSSKRPVDSEALFYKPTSRFCTQQNPSKQNQHHYTWLHCSLRDVVVKGIVGQNMTSVGNSKTQHTLFCKPLLKHVVRFWRVSFAFLTFSAAAMVPCAASSTWLRLQCLSSRSNSCHVAAVLPARPWLLRHRRLVLDS